MKSPQNELCGGKDGHCRRKIESVGKSGCAGGGGG
jgi:hypothetical protein